VQSVVVKPSLAVGKENLKLTRLAASIPHRTRQASQSR